jgi:phosphatidylserine decarboxylase
MKIHKEGGKVIPFAYFMLALLDALIYYFLRDYLVFYLLMLASLILAVLIVFFFRVPDRKIDRNISHVLAPADGSIVEIKEVFEKEYFNDNRIQVSIFMSPLNIHQNRAPVSGKVTYQHHKRGVYYPAFVEKSSELNERCSTVFKTESGDEIMSRQIAGTVARRICTYKKPGDFVDQGAEYGFIRFGSRVDIFLPLTAKIEVELGTKPVAGKTVIATI